MTSVRTALTDAHDYTFPELASTWQDLRTVAESISGKDVPADDVIVAEAERSAH